MASLNIEEIISKVKGKKKVDVHGHIRKVPTGGLTAVEPYTKYIEKEKKEDEVSKPEDIDSELLTVEQVEKDYADEDIPIEENLTPLEKANLPEDTRHVSELIKAWQIKKDEEAIKKLISKYEKIILFHANKYKTSPLPNSLTILEAKRLLVKAVDTYNPTKKAAFNTHLTNYLKKLFRFVGDNQNIAKIPEQRIRKINAYKIALAKLEDRLGHEPTDAEMADQLSWALKEVVRLRNELGRAEIIQFGGDYSYSDLGIVSEKTPIAIKLVYFDSTSDEKFVMEHIYPVFGKKQMSIKEIAKKLKLKESKVKYIISDIKRKIIENL